MLRTCYSSLKKCTFSHQKIGKDTLLIIYQQIMIAIYRLFLSPFQHGHRLNMRRLREHINWVNAAKIITQFLEFL